MSIRTDLGKRNKEKLLSLVNAAGYDNFRQFCMDVNVDQSNLYSNLEGKWGMSVKRMFKIANLLHVDILQILEIFYTEAYEENKRIANVPIVSE